MGLALARFALDFGRGWEGGKGNDATFVLSRARHAIIATSTSAHACASVEFLVLDSASELRLHHDASRSTDYEATVTQCGATSHHAVAVRIQIFNGAIPKLQILNPSAMLEPS